MKYKSKDINIFPKDTGVYKIYFLNSESSKVYIGSASGTLGFYGRWKSHLSGLRNNKSKNKILQLATNKYEIDNMIFEIVEYCDRDNCIEREQYYINKYNSYNYGYNARPKADNNSNIIMSDEQKIKISNKWRPNRDLYVDDVRRLYEIEGKTTREICKILHISRNFLKKIFTENKIEARKESGLKKRKIYQYKEGIKVSEWDSLNECLREQNFNANGVRLVLIGKCIHYKGYYFSYTEISLSDFIKIEDEFKTNSKGRKYYYYDNISSSKNSDNNIDQI